MVTEKRFVIPDGGLDTDVTLIDTLTGKEYEDNFNDIVDLMNDLHNKNDWFEFILQEAIRTERTDMGKNVLIQLADNLGVKYE